MFKPIFKAVAVSTVAAFFCVGCGGETPDDDNDSYTYSGGTIRVGNQTWMARNLDRATANSKCYANSADSCAKYGRLYDWNAAMKACPFGWHLPSDVEWTTLTEYAGGDSTAGKKLKSKSGWANNGADNGAGTDEFNFSALPGGYGGSDGTFSTTGYDGFWWSATDRNANAYIRRMYNYAEYVDKNIDSKTNLFSVRCVQD